MMVKSRQVLPVRTVWGRLTTRFLGFTRPKTRRECWLKLARFCRFLGRLIPPSFYDLRDKKRDGNKQLILLGNHRDKMRRGWSQYIGPQVLGCGQDLYLWNRLRRWDHRRRRRRRVWRADSLSAPARTRTPPRSPSRIDPVGRGKK